MKAYARRVLPDPEFAAKYPLLTQFYARQRLLSKVQSKSWKDTAKATGDRFCLVARPSRIQPVATRMPQELPSDDIVKATYSGNFTHNLAMVTR